MAITSEEIEKLAILARIQISDQEKESMRKDIESILAYVKLVAQFHSDEGGAGTSIPLLRNIMRDDVVTRVSGEYTEDILNLAPARDGNYLKVKKILS